MPKTGGTSLVNLLHQHYGLAQSRLMVGDEDPAWPQVLAQSTPFIHGHFSFRRMEEAGAYFKASILRHPVERVISRYVHLMHSKEERLIQERQQYAGFEDYLKSPYARDHQAQLLAGVPGTTPLGPKEILRAEQNLLALDWVATLDQMPTAALDLSLKLGFKSYYQPHLNQRQSDQLWQDCAKRYSEEIAHYNQVDFKLYELAKARYQAEEKIPALARLKLWLKSFK